MPASTEFLKTKIEILDLSKLTDAMKKFVDTEEYQTMTDLVSKVQDEVKRNRNHNQIAMIKLDELLQKLFAMLDIKNLDEYRHVVMRTYKKEGIESLMKLLRQPSPAYVQYDDFYRLFDEIFMGIFPDFLDKVNAMLQEESRISLAKDGSFPTKLRILAVMRLGLEDSGKIAEFLNCSAQTVYSYRTQMRNAATCPRGEFEKRILQIGITEE